MNSTHLWLKLNGPIDKSELRDMLLSLTMALGFEKVLLTVIPAVTSSHCAPLVLTNCDEHWARDHYKVRNDNSDPIFAHCRHHQQPLLWDEHYFSEAGHPLLYQEFARQGMRLGVSLPSHGPHGEMGALTMAMDTMEPIRNRQQHLMQCLPELALARDVFLEAAARLRDAQRGEPPKLSTREVECLKWHAAGKTSWEIGAILNVSESCINFHFANIRRKFNVSHRHEAMLKAVQWGLIRPGQILMH
ncbi:hypothetical protein RB25_23100 [Herbaspirillum rubrisubalbicans]|uniref:HTH luxR-type domain-containing protein n=1 Tax=Herbaspirillum rubrisubalbicans TaxID=80842 RepID=A0ABX9BXE7_9BURK|nr:MULTISPECIES: LuxR family transcriptional regulator [Herbaspirillum]RAM62619.1 hypothetical protein RB24_20105 [Herbaspirillum rubrisubalbicans]RAN43655.1 hypothetical protein RB25_23100 [Herbaspirillum rubrisubalbicans]